ncbi:hypothetical protein ACFWBN_05780 [Streptomyces sp. NPDC059989]|uniref:hypothetical protein n=1 Tax=Streptomyces sp. NPDC059989 TaxID=3347026 RepID=UPI003675E2CE
MGAWWVMSFSDVRVLSSTPSPDAVITGLLAVSMEWLSIDGSGRRYLCSYCVWAAGPHGGSGRSWTGHTRAA